MAKKPKIDVEDVKIVDEAGAEDRFQDATKRLFSTPPKPKTPTKDKRKQ